jgi:cAMP-dependent protein kinase regulator
MSKGTVCEGLCFAKDTEKYINTVLDPVLEEMISEVITKQPENALDYMITWLQKRCGKSTGQGRMSVVQLNQMLKNDLTRQAGALGEMSSQFATDDHDDEEDEEDEDDEPPADFFKDMSQKGARGSVSAEAYGTWNEKKAFEPPKYPKSDDQKVRLGETLAKSFMFNSLEPSDMDVIILAMKECSFSAGTKVIEEGESGDYLFVIEKGSLECMKVINGESKVVKTCSEGDVFGELALLYNCPRAANVVASCQCVCWQLDRETFSHIVKDSAVRRREKYDNFLQSVTLLSNVDMYERSQIADALVSETFSAGQYVVKQDEPGSKFYIVESGSLYALKDDSRVRDYKPGDYFGELALLKNQPRAASIVVSSESARLVSMSRQSFSKMLGPLHHLLNSRVNSYV